MVKICELYKSSKTNFKIKLWKIWCFDKSVKFSIIVFLIFECNMVEFVKGVKRVLVMES